MAECALVVVEGRYQLGQSLIEPRNRVRRPVLELADVERHVDDRRSRPDIRTAIDFRSANLEHRVVLRSRGRATYRMSMSMTWRASTSKRRPSARTCRDDPVIVRISPCSRWK